MSIPFVVNRAPANGSLGGVTESVRFGVRDSTTEINRSALQCYLGQGTTFYRGDVLPEDHSTILFYLQAFQGSPNAPASRTIEIDGSLKLEKVLTPLPKNQEAVYFFGGPQAEADPEDAFMVEATLRLDQVDVTADVNGFTGVAFGLMANLTGLAVKFYTDGVNRRIEIQQAAHATTAPPSGAYVAPFDWNGTFFTYKLLWHPARNIVRLYVSSGSGDTADTLLVDGLVTDFPNLPSLEQRTQVPWAFFGHLAQAASSTSYWKEVFLYNFVTNPLYDGIFTSGHEGFIRTNNQVVYTADNLPRKDLAPWNLLPASFGPIAGTELLSTEGLTLVRSDLSSSFGFYRREPKIAVVNTIFDFHASGLVHSQDVGVESTGMEFYVDDGVRACRVAFLQAPDGTQYVGILSFGTMPALISSYAAMMTSFGVVEHYRIVFRPGNSATLYQVIDQVDNQGKDLQEIVTLPYGSLPITSMPGPGLGFLHNETAGAATGILKVRNILYRVGEDFVSPAEIAGWTQTGSGTVDTSGEAIVLSDANELETGNILLSKPYGTLLQADNGFVAEFRARVDSYELGGVLDPVREFTGAVLRIIDGTNQLTLVFADAGPPFGRVVFLQTRPDIDQNIYDIRVLVPGIIDTFWSIDWTHFHLYRLERTVGGKLSLYVDESAIASIEFDEVNFSYPATPGGSARVEFGHIGDGVKTISEWSFLNFCRSDGFDVSVLPKQVEEELFSHFDRAVNVIVEAEDV